MSQCYPDFDLWEYSNQQQDSSYHQYTSQATHGFVYPLEEEASYAALSLSDHLPVDLMQSQGTTEYRRNDYCDYLSPGIVQPLYQTAYSCLSSFTSLPTESFEPVAATNYSTPSTFDFPLIDSTQSLNPTVDNSPLSSHYPSPDFLHGLDQTLSGIPSSSGLLSSDVTLQRKSSSSCSSPLSLIPLPETRLIVSDPRIAKKRRQISESSHSDSRVRPRRTRIVKCPKATANVRKIGACFYCKRRHTSCVEGDHPNGPCMPCLELAQRTTTVSGPPRPLCWRPPKLKTAEIFRRGPTIDFAASLRGHKSDAEPGKQAVWDLFATGAKGDLVPKVVELSQYWTSNTLRVELHGYLPMETDRQFYTWHDNCKEEHYKTPSYGIANWRKVSWSIEKFMEQNFEEYVEAHLRDASEITRATFRIALRHKNLHLVDRALKLWVGCRFIEEPWSIVSTSETLGLSPDPNPASPYHTRIPVPPVVDMQIDLIVINTILQPLFKETMETMNDMLEKNGPWKDWFEIYLAYFVLLCNVELTMKHDAWFVRRHNLKTKYSNRPLIETIMQGATTLLTCFHYAHQGYAPFTNPDLEKSQSWTEEQLGFIRSMRILFLGVDEEHKNDPAKELFWTSQLHKEDWGPASVF